MSHPVYARYQESGFEWLGAIPSAWACAPLWAVATCNDDVLPESTAPDEEVHYVEISGVTAGQGITEVSDLMFSAAPSRARRRVQDGDVLVSTVRTYLRAIAPVVSPPGNMIVSTGFAVLRPRAIAAKYLGYAVQAEYFISEVIARSVGVSYPAINASDLMRIAVPVPSLAEQTAIAAFLDRETGKIDALVEEQRRLIELLKEKRQAVISHAVTKGIDPNVKLKPSGVEWLGGVPEHWEVVSIRRIAQSVQTGRTPTSEAPEVGEGEVPWYTPGDFGAELDLREAYKAITHGSVERGEANLFPPGSVLVVSIGATLGKVGLSTNWCSANQQINAIVPTTRVEAEFLAWSLTGKADVMRYLSNASTIGIMNQEKTKEIVLALPPNDEQRTISQHLTSTLKQLAALEAAALSAIDILVERRAALISAAVTGKIDVRGVAAAETVAA